MALLIFELSPTSLFAHPSKAFTVLDCLESGLSDRFGGAQTIPLFSSQDAAHICVQLDTYQQEALTVHDFEEIERFCSQGNGYLFAEFLDWRRREQQDAS